MIVRLECLCIPFWKGFIRNFSKIYTGHVFCVTSKLSLAQMVRISDFFANFVEYSNANLKMTQL